MTMLIAKRQYSYVGRSAIIKADKIDKDKASADSRHERYLNSIQKARRPEQALYENIETSNAHRTQKHKKNSCSDEL